MFGLGRKADSAPDGQWLERDGERFWLPWKPHAKARRLKLLVGNNGPRLTLASGCPGSPMPRPDA